MALSVGVLIDSIRDWVKDPNVNEWEGTQILRFINRANENYCYKFMKAMQPCVFRMDAGTLITHDGSTTRFDITPYISQIFGVDILDSTTDTNPVDMLPISGGGWRQRNYYNDELSVGTGPVWTIEGNRLLVLPTQSSGQYAKAYQWQKPTSLHYGNLTSPDTAVMTLDTSPTVGSWAAVANSCRYTQVILTGTGEINTIKSNTKAGVCTMQFSWETKPTTADEYSLLSPLPEDLHELLILAPARDILIINKEPINEINFRIEDLENNLYSFAGSMQSQTGKRVMKTAWG